MGGVNVFDVLFMDGLFGEVVLFVEVFNGLFVCLFLVFDV